MNLHEYQAKALLAHYGIPVPRGEVVTHSEEVPNVVHALGLMRWVAKAQVHAGGRGKAGGVQLVSSSDELVDIVKSMLGSRLITAQTTALGQPIHQVLIEEPCDIQQELYLGAVIDRAKQRIVFMVSSQGGMDIEAIAAQSPESIIIAVVEPMIGLQPYQGRHLGYALRLQDAQIPVFTQMLLNLYQLFKESDISLLEINPLVITKQGKLLCLDTKINVDDNALYRQPRLRQLRDVSQEDERENRAREWELNYIALSGDIGCMVNGAGLAMATMDLIKLHGGEPANFLDVGGGATEERVTEAFKIILSDEKIKAILINIFGGIVRCDLIADGIIHAVAEVGTVLPVVVRLEGNRAAIGLKKLQDSGLNIIPAASFDEAARRVVAAAEQGRGRE